MKYSLFSTATFLLVLSVLLAGCAISGKVTDLNNKTTRVSSMRLSEPGTLRVLDGNAIRELRLNKIKILRIQSEVSKIFNRELFCMAEIVFKDGKKIGSFEKERANAYVAANSYLYGKAQKSEYRIMLSDVLKIELAY